jgi:hypothetical protein
MGKIILGVWVVVILFAGFWFGYYQEGANRDLTLETEGTFSVSAPISMNIEINRVYVTSNKLAFDFDWKGRFGKCRQIIDFSKNESYLVLLDRKQYAPSKFTLVPASQCEPAKRISWTQDEALERLPHAATFAKHYRCHAFKPADSGSKSVKLWFTYEIRLGRDHVSLINKLMRMKGEEGVSFGGLSTIGGGDKTRKQVASFEYFPIPLRVEGVTGPVSLSFEVKSISRDKIDRSVFVPPSDCKEISQEALAKELLGGLRLQ